MVVFPNAKINIGLHITGKRPDGYHNLESCFYPIGWADILEVVESDSTTFHSTGIPIPGNWEENLCIKAYKLLKDKYSLPPVKMHLHKVIPIGAGLGGGSADGAFALKALNELFDLKISNTQLEIYALQLGSDCPFFIDNQPKFVKGRGELFENLQLDLKGKIIVMVNPPIHVSTGEAYGGIKNYSQEGELKINLEKSPVSDWKDAVANDFEVSVFHKYPSIAEIKGALYDKGAMYASMTGSGASVYGIFDELKDCKNWFPAGYTIWQGQL